VIPARNRNLKPNSRLPRLLLAARNAFTLVEALTAAVIVTVSGAAMLLAIGQSLQATTAGSDTHRVSLLADELMAEISACRLADLGNPTHWGPEEGEHQNPTRAGFDDIDDYDGWNGVPQTKTGVHYHIWQKNYFDSVPTHPYAAYMCHVAVEKVSAAGTVLTGNESSSYRRVTVEVTRDSKSVVLLSQTFFDLGPLLGRDHWYDPDATEPPATVEVVP